MLKIYYGSEAAPKESFIFDRIDPDRQTIIIVPDQYSLQMEKNVLEHFREKTGRRTLLNIMVADFNALGNKVVREAGGRMPELIDRYGRHMLLAVVVSRLAKAERLGIYRKMEGRSSFISEANQMISEMKRYGVSPADIGDAAEKADGFLKLKLNDIEAIYDEYEDSIQGRFTDTEDYMSLCGKLMETSEIIKGADIWVYGFDTFTPLNMQFMGSLLMWGSQLNVVMTCEYTGETSVRDARILTAGEGEGLFELPKMVINSLKQMAESRGIGWTTEEIPGPEGLPLHECTLVEATNVFAEADRVAAHIMDLVRDRGFRYGDITVICNDMDSRGRVLKRTLDRWGIPVFIDRKRTVMHQPVVRFILSFAEVITEGYDGDSIMEMVSTGMLGFAREDEELLINYVRDAGIRGSKWKSPFTKKGTDDRGSAYSNEELERLNEMRSFIVGITERARNEMGRRNSAREKVTGLYSFLENDFGIRSRIGELIELQKELGLAEGAAETAQSWNMICGLFTQIIRIIGDENISGVQLKEVLAAGLEEMEIGLVPTSSDCVIIGTIQRTRITGTKSLIVTAANEGILPMAGGESGLLTERELQVLEEMEYSLTKKEEVRMAEEQLAIYRMFSMPSEDLFVTYSLADRDGKSISPSGIVSVLKEEGSSILGDLDSDEVMEMIASPKGTMSYMSDAIHRFIETGRIEDEWLDAINWYKDNMPETMSKIMAGLNYSNRIEALERDVADKLYFGDRDAIFVSASRLENYSGCPFRHFLQKGLEIREPRKFVADAASRGDIYHMALQRLAESLMPEEGISVTDPASPWMTVTEEECSERVEAILADSGAAYREGVYTSDGEGRLQFLRITRTCSEIAWAMVSQIRKSRTVSMRFEESFGFSDSVLAPIEVKLENGRKAVLVGRIDRIDVIDGGTDDEGNRQEVLRVIDYKTGNAAVNREQIEKGYKLQLMTYMNAAIPGKSADESLGEAADEGDSRMVPAGAFYFKIGSLDIDGDAAGIPESREEVADRIAGTCRLEGLMVDDENILKVMDETLEPGVSSRVISVRQLKNGSIKPSGACEMMSTEEFRELCSITARQVERICREIQEGRIDIAPKKERKSGPDGEAITACRYCSCKSICLFDTSFRDCRYELV